MNKLRYGKTFLLGFGFFAISVMWSVYNAFMPLILKDFIGSAAIIGFIMTIDNYFAIIIQPTVGAISDKIDTKFGRRMPFILIGMPIASVLLIVLANYSGFVMLIIFLVLTNLTMSIFRSPVISLMPDITHKENRSKANSIINFMGGIGAVIAYFIGAKLWNMNPKFPFYLSGILMFISFIVLFIFIKEKKDAVEYHTIDREEKISDIIKKIINIKNIICLILAAGVWTASYLLLGSIAKLDIKYTIPFSTGLMLLSFLLFYLIIVKSRNERRDMVINLKESGKNRNVLFLLAAICSWFIAYQGIEAFLSLYGVNYLKLEEGTAAMLFTFISISFLVFSIPAGLVGTRIGKKKAITIGIIGLAGSFGVIALSNQIIIGISKLLGYFGTGIEIKHLLVIQIMLAVAGFFWAMININSYPFVADMAGKGETGKYTGLYYLASSIAAIVSPPLLGFVIDLAGYKYMFIYGIAFMFIAFLFMNFIKQNSTKSIG